MVQARLLLSHPTGPRKAKRRIDAWIWSSNSLRKDPQKKFIWLPWAACHVTLRALQLAPGCRVDTMNSRWFHSVSTFGGDHNPYRYAVFQASGNPLLLPT